MTSFSADDKPAHECSLVKVVSHEQNGKVSTDPVSADATREPRTRDGVANRLVHGSFDQRVQLNE